MAILIRFMLLRISKLDFRVATWSSIYWNDFYNKPIILTQPVYCIPEIDLYLVDPLQGHTINYYCTFITAGILRPYSTTFNAQN